MLKIPKTYLVEQKDGFRPTYSIKAPSVVPELQGYVMKILQEDVKIEDATLIIRKGNEWNKVQKSYFFMFEKAVKVSGKNSKRFRYSEEQLFKMYGMDQSSTFEERFEERRNRSQTGAGKLIRARYTEFSQEKGKYSTTGWFILTDANSKWVYTFEYDPLRDQGKHNKDAKGFDIEEQYPVEDVSNLWDNRVALNRLLRSLDYTRNLAVSEGFSAWIRGSHPKQFRNAQTLADELAFIALNHLPDDLTVDSCIRGKYESENGARIRADLMKLTEEIERRCRDEVETYRAAEILKISEKIKDLIGIEINK